MMETKELISTFQDFFDENARQDIIKATHKDRKWLKVNYQQLISYHPDIEEHILNDPIETLHAADIALHQLDHIGNVKDMTVRILGLSHSSRRKAWEIRSEDIGKFIALEGIINKASPVLYHCISARYECNACGVVTVKYMKDNKFGPPKRCSCGDKKGFRIISKEMQAQFKLGIIDDLMDENNKGRAAAREIIVELKGDLTHKEIDMQIKPGRKVIVNGYLEYRQKKENLTEFEAIFNANSIEFVKVGWDVIPFKPQEEQKIKELAKTDNIITRLADSIADVQGHTEAKIASILLLAGAPNIYDLNNHLASRGTMHVLLIGNPGTAKTFLAKRAGSISPIFSFQSAANASGKGLVASVAQDADIGTWAVYPGVVAMASKGVVVIDEIDKTHKEDYGDHNNAMNDMEVNISKATVKARLETETSYLATANPENRIFSHYESFFSQIDMPKDFLDRFDIIFPILAPREKESREQIVDTMLDRHLEQEQDRQSWKPEFEHEFIRKYIAYCRVHNPRPKVNKNTFPNIKAKLMELMKPKDDQQTTISFRQLESIMRFAYAAARLRLTDVDDKAIDLAFQLKRKSFMDLDIIKEDGSFSWDSLEGIEENVIEQKASIMDVIKDLERRVGAMIPIEDILTECHNKGLDRDEVEKFIEKKKRLGDFFEPKRGVLKRL